MILAKWKMKSFLRSTCRWKNHFRKPYGKWHLVDQDISVRLGNVFFSVRHTENFQMVRLTVRQISVMPTENTISVSFTENTISVRPTKKQFAVTLTENQFSVSLTENQLSVSLTENMVSVRPTENFDSVMLTVCYPNYNSNFINFFLFWFFFVQCQKTLTFSWRQSKPRARLKVWPRRSNLRAGPFCTSTHKNVAGTSVSACTDCVDNAQVRTSAIRKWSGQFRLRSSV